LKRRLLAPGALVIAALTFSQSAGAASTEPLFTSDTVERYANQIFYNSGATGMALVVIDGNQRVFRSFGETRPGNNVRPQLDSVVRIASHDQADDQRECWLSCSTRGWCNSTIRSSKYAPPGAYGCHPITASPFGWSIWRPTPAPCPANSQAASLHRPVFVWPTRQQRWNWLESASLKHAPGSQAAYSNLAYDLLADALARASGKPYPRLFDEQIARPLGMKDTTFTPSPDQCGRLMIPERGASPCNNTLAAVGSGGVYSTPDDMMRWMQQFLASDFHIPEASQADQHADADLPAQPVC
jgi:D-alanyl-D-alanine-carboxypeptidase/D-alanyl-D-alanine-endopeptidase